MTEPVPIRPGVEPDLDVARELRDYAWGKVDDYVAQHGEPHSIAFVLIGRDAVGTPSIAYSWSPRDEGSTLLHSCSVAAALLTRRALEA